MQSIGTVLAAYGVAATGLLFWAGKPFCWAGEPVDVGTQHGIGLALVLLGVAMAFVAGRFARRSGLARN